MSDLLDEDEQDAPRRKFIDLAQLGRDFRTYYLLFITIFAVLFGITVAIVALMPPTYTATATLGPADNSDQPFSNADISSIAKSGLGSIAKHLGAAAGGALDQSDEVFEEYTTLFTSYRLASILASKDRLLPEVFSDKWDAQNHRWYPRDNFLDETVDFFKTLLRRPVKAAPDADDLAKYLTDYMKSDTSLETGYATVTMQAGSPAEAERLLNLILSESDNIIREDKRRDVLARIAYLNRILEHNTLAEQRPELIDILSEQQQEMMMIESDHLYASLMIDAPHAPLKPSSPVPTLDAAIALVLSILAWLGAVRYTPPTGRWRRVVDSFARPRERSRKVNIGAPARAGGTV